MAGGSTTSGHGIFSQYRPEHMKQWILGESRHGRPHEETTKSLKSLKTLTRLPDDPALAGGRGGEDLGSAYKRIPDASALLASTSGPIDLSTKDGIWDMTTSSADVSRDGPKQSLPPHMIHHHHFGWQPSQNDQQRLLGTLLNRDSYRRYGDALSYCQQIHTKHSLINTRKS